MIDFTDYEIDYSHTYNGGNGNKIAIKYDDDIYMLKFPSRLKKGNLSYSNSVISEYISCHIFDMLGFKTQKTILGMYRINDKVKIVCACKDFTNDHMVLQDFASIKNTIIDSEMNGYGTELSEIIDTIKSQKLVDCKKLNDYFWDMFIVDSLLGNFDRHNGNWGFLYDRKDDSACICPIYDCGSCLFPQADDDMLEFEIHNEDELNQRVYVFPNSAIKIDNIKINPFKYIYSLENIDCNSALKRIFPKINITKISEFIDNVPYITDVRKLYYKTIIKMRYEKIIKASYEKLMDNELG